MIDRDTVQRILDASHIEEVVGEFVSLKKRGANHIGCCPFHNEKTPSFYVSPSKGIYKCFGCGEAGDVVKFLMKHERYTYPEALRWLAAKYNIDIQEQEYTEEEKQKQTERDGLFHVSEFAQKYFADMLWNDDMGRAVGLSYFRSRGLSDDIIHRFGLGFCLDEWNAFTEHAMRNGYSATVLDKSGLTIFKEDTQKHYDRFRGRVMFPIYSVSGRVLGFSGRVLSSEKQAAKYVNSPDSEIYNKSRILYGLYQAVRAISKADKCYLVEGNIDVISMHQSGVENVVASCGTSLTTEQIRLIKRYTPNVTVLYDGDAAGIKAALRAVDLLFAEGMHVRLVLFPDGEDPDSYAQKYGSEALQTYLKEHEDNFILFKTKVMLDEVKNDPIRRTEVQAETARSIAMVSDMLERSEYIRQCAHLLHVGEDKLTVAVAQAVAKQRSKANEQEAKQQQAAVDAAQAAEQTAPDAEAEPAPLQPRPTLAAPPEYERHICWLLLNYGNDELVKSIKQPDDTYLTYTFTVAEGIVADINNGGINFSHPLCQRILEQCMQMVDAGQPIDASVFLSDDDDALRSFAGTLMIEEYTVCEQSWKAKGVITPKITDNLLADVEESLYTLKLKNIRQHIDELGWQLKEAEATADYERQALLLAEKQEYHNQMHKLGNKQGYIIIPRLT